MPENNLEKLRSEYVTERPKYVAFTENLRGLIYVLTRSQGIDSISIESRTKDIESFDAKIGRESKAGKYSHVTNITDLSGIRIVVYYLDDVIKICNLIEENFEIDIANSVNKNVSIEADRFGYLSIHYVASHNSLRCDLPENKQFSGMKAEIQIRTVLQHAWAVLDRRLRYNNEDDIPREIRRKFFRISALLEAADENLSEIGRQVIQLRQKYHDEIQSGNPISDINLESLEIYWENSPMMQHLRDIRAQIQRQPSLDRIELDRILKAARMADLTKISQIDKAADQFRHNAATWLNRIVEPLQKQSSMKIVISDNSLFIYPIALSIEKSKMKKLISNVYGGSRINAGTIINSLEEIWDEINKKS